MYSLSHLSRQVEALRSRLKPVLAILKLRKLAMEFCGEFDEAALSEDPEQPHRYVRYVHAPRGTGRLLDTFQDLCSRAWDRQASASTPSRTWLTPRALRATACPDPREIVFTLIPWARKGPILLPDLWECPAAA